MEPRNDSTWLFVGVGVGCLLVLLVLMCLGSGAAYFMLGRSSGGTPSRPPMTGVPPTSIPPPSVPPPSIAPPATLAPPVTATIDAAAERVVHASVTSVTGTPGVSVGQACDFNVERRDRDDGAGFWCNAQVVCGGHLLYGGPTAGFFPCTLFEGTSRHVVGGDTNTTGEETNGDAAMTIDSRQSALEIWDDAQGPNGEFHVVAHIDSIE